MKKKRFLLRPAAGTHCTASRRAARQFETHGARQKTGAVKHDIFHNIAQYIEPGDCLILNDTKVLPARLYGTRVDTGSAVEFLLLNNKGDDIWEVITGPGKKARKS